MSLVLTRRPGEAIVLLGPEGLPPRRLYVVSIEGNVVRLAIDAPAEIRIVREELMGGGRSLGAALLAVVASALHSIRELFG